jgi:hypothetical protein
MSNNAIPSWDAKLWLQKFEYSKGFVGGTRPVRAEVFQSTLKIVRFGKGLFREIHFAIIEDHNSKGQNYNAFKEDF